MCPGDALVLVQEFQLALTLVPPSDKRLCFSSAKKKSTKWLRTGRKYPNLIYERQARAKDGELLFISPTPFVPRFNMLHQIVILLHECVCLKGRWQSYLRLIISLLTTSEGISFSNKRLGGKYHLLLGNCTIFSHNTNMGQFVLPQDSTVCTEDDYIQRRNINSTGCWASLQILEIFSYPHLSLHKNN